MNPTITTIQQKEQEKQEGYPKFVLFIPYEANLRKARTEKECRFCGGKIMQGDLYYSISYRIGVDAHPAAVHANDLEGYIKAMGLEG